MASANDQNTITKLARASEDWMGEGCVNLLEWCGILPSPDSPWAIDRADSAARVAISTSVRHALRPRVWINPFSAAIHAILSWNWGNGNASGTTLWVHGRPTLVVAGTIADDGHAIWSDIVVPAEALELRRRQAVV